MLYHWRSLTSTLELNVIRPLRFNGNCWHLAHCVVRIHLIRSIVLGVLVLGVWRLLDYSVAVRVGVANRVQFSKPINRSQTDIGSNCQAPDVLFTLSWNQWLETFKYSFHVEINFLKNVIFCCHYYDGGTLVRYLPIFAGGHRGRLRSLTHLQG